MKESSLRSRVSSVLPAGELYVGAVQLYTGPIVRLGTMPLRIPLHPRVLVVSDRGVYLYTASWLRACLPKSLVAALSPSALGEPHRHELQWETEIEINGETHWASFAWRKEVKQVVEACAQLVSGPLAPVGPTADHNPN